MGKWVLNPQGGGTSGFVHHSGSDARNAEKGKTKR